MSKAIHIFGCSFSVGYGLDPNVSVIPLGYQSYYKWGWNTKIKEFFKDYKVYNHAVPGVSNQVIKDTLLKNLHLIKKGDIVVYGITDFRRISIPLNHTHKHIQGRYLNLTGRGYIEYLENIMEKQKPTPNFVPHYLKPIFKKNKIKDTLFNTLVTFYQDFIYPTKYEKLNEVEYKNIVSSLTEFFDTLDIKFYAWDATIWGDGENITTWSNGQYDDGHWSPNGNNFLLGYLLWGIKNNRRYLNLELLREHREDIKKFTEKQSLGEYIEHRNTALLI